VSAPIIPGNQPQYSLANLMPAPVPPRRPGWIVPVIAGLAVLLLAAAGLAGWALLSRPTTPTAAPSPTRINVVAPPNDPPPAVIYSTPSPSDFVLTIKTLEKKCFGSAGCLVTFRIELSYSGPKLDPSVTYEVTYDVTGAEDPLTNTLELTGDEYSTDREQTVSTASSKAKLRATVTSVGEA
jgi:hypothetical protein